MKSAFYVSGLLLAVFIASAIAGENMEFVFYAATIVLLIAMIFGLDRRFDLTATVLWGFNGWIALHMAGGMLQVNGVRLYDLVLITVVGPPYDILKYDQVVHFYCYVVVALLLHEVLQRYKKDRGAVQGFLVTVLAAAGVGSCNEIIEFGAVVLLDSTGVGGYTNTALDLVANLVGAMAGAGYRLIWPVNTPVRLHEKPDSS